MKSSPTITGTGMQTGRWCGTMLEIFRATGQSASMRHSARRAEKMEKDPSLSKRLRK